MKVTITKIFDDLFCHFLHLIDTAVIKAGSDDERRYLELKANFCLKQFCALNRIHAPCQVKIVMPKSDLEQIRFEIDEITTQELKRQSLLI
jgi:hypothetical protein